MTSLHYEGEGEDSSDSDSESSNKIISESKMKRSTSNSMLNRKSSVEHWISVNKFDERIRDTDIVKFFAVFLMLKIMILQIEI